MSGFNSSSSSNGVLNKILQELKLKAGLDSDSYERIQQQLAKINEDENLKPGERHYG